MVQEINTNLNQIKKNSKSGIWRAFFNGMFGAFGYLVGIILVVVIVGWFLNKIGLLGPFQQQWKKFETFMSQAENTLNSAQPQQGSSPSDSAGSYMITLPNGQKAQVTPQ